MWFLDHAVSGVGQWRRRTLRLLVGIVTLACAASPLRAASDHDRLLELLNTLTQDLVGTIGIAAQHSRSQEIVLLNGDLAFPMASTYKIPIGIALLRRVDRGEISLDDMIQVQDESLVFSQVIASAFPHSGVSLSVANLIEIMITFSDNTATDLCLSLAGGPAAVTRAMQELGVSALTVDRSTGEILEAFYGVAPGKNSLGDAVALMLSDPNRINAPRADFESDGLDQSTPRAMLSVLRKLRAGEAVSPESTAFLLGAMSRTTTKPERLGLLLPKGTAVAHKTGTIGGVANEVGYIGLPSGNEFAIVVFTKGSSTPPKDRERAVAEVARTLYDFFAITVHEKESP